MSCLRNYLRNLSVDVVHLRVNYDRKSIQCEDENFKHSGETYKIFCRLNLTSEADSGDFMQHMEFLIDTRARRIFQGIIEIR